MPRLSHCSFRERKEPVHGRETKRVTSMSEERLAQAIREEKLPKVCEKHPRAVWHDEVECPACRAEREFLELSKGME